MELEARNVPPDLSQHCGIARRCKLFLGTELGRGALVQEDPFVWPPMERRREFAAASLQAQPYLEPENNARWARLSIVCTWLIKRGNPALGYSEGLVRQADNTPETLFFTVTSFTPELHHSTNQTSEAHDSWQEKLRIFQGQ
jgi:hypothetical protein